jgi:glutaredoxin
MLFGDRMFEKFILFTTPMCPVCNEIKDWLSTTDYKVEFVDAASPEGKAKAAKFNIINVPTMISLDKDGNRAGEATDLDGVQEMLENKTLKDF